MATPVSIPNTFVDGVVADGPQHNANFKSIQDYVNQKIIASDGSVAFTALPNVPASDPSTDTQLARGRYIEKRGVGQSKVGIVSAGPFALVTNPATTTVVTFDIAIPAWVTTVTYKAAWTVSARCTSNSPMTVLSEVLCEGVLVDSSRSTVFETIANGGITTWSHSCVTTVARGDGTHTWVLRLSKIGASPVGDYFNGTSLSVFSFNDDLTVL